MLHPGIHVEIHGTLFIREFEEATNSNRLQMGRQVDVNRFTGGKYCILSCRSTGFIHDTITDLQPRLTITFMILRILLKTNIAQRCIHKGTIFNHSDFLRNSQITGFCGRTEQQGVCHAVSVDLIQNAVLRGKIFATGLYMNVFQSRITLKDIKHLELCSTIEIIQVICTLQSGRQGHFSKCGAGKRLCTDRQFHDTALFEDQAGHAGVCKGISIDQRYSLGDSNLGNLGLEESMIIDSFQLSTQGQGLQFAGTTLHRKGILADLGHLAIGVHGSGSQRSLVIESVSTDQCDTVTEGDLNDLCVVEHAVLLVTIFKRAQSKRLGALCEGYSDQLRVGKCAITDGLHIGGNVDFGDLGVLQHVLLQVGNLFGNYKHHQAGILKCAFTDFRGASRQFNTGQQTTACECACANGHAGTALFECHFSQIVTVLESVITDGNDVFAEIHFGDSGIILEHIGTNLLKVRMELSQITVQISGVE